MGEWVPPVVSLVSSSQAPAGLVVHQERKEPQNRAQDKQGRAVGFQTRCHFLTQCSQPEPLLVAGHGALPYPMLGPLPPRGL